MISWDAGYTWTMIMYFKELNLLVMRYFCVSEL